MPRAAWLSAATALLTLYATAPAGAADGWQRVGTDTRSGVSGIAYESRTGSGAGIDALVVHDNKKSGLPHLSRLTHSAGSADVAPLTWDGPEPVDLEAVEAVPGKPGEYMALAGRGIAYHLKVAGSTATVVDYTPLPAIGEGDDFESFALVHRDGQLAALWADRGAGTGRAATLYAAPLSFAPWGEAKFGTVTRQTYRAPYPTDTGTRHISDISVTDSGRILVSSASDAGDDGPFNSAVSAAGWATASAEGGVRVVLSPRPTVLGRFPHYKIEAVECLPGTADALLGTDDENVGGYVRTLPFCGI
ncbi:hypothetical protein GUY60_24085 [Streptomyces sp. YC537]|uniref:Uncharacterized protein n=1 Tax=Streptomyces boluensis TaxID=1775135 RepID=A0A964XNQ6_9ACTN|nr:hypothetical protein [Streptomyces boluensis]